MATRQKAILRTGNQYHERVEYLPVTKENYKNYMNHLVSRDHTLHVMLSQTHPEWLFWTNVKIGDSRETFLDISTMKHALIDTTLIDINQSIVQLPIKLKINCVSSEALSVKTRHFIIYLRSNIVDGDWNIYNSGNGYWENGKLVLNIHNVSLDFTGIYKDNYETILKTTSNIQASLEFTHADKIYTGKTNYTFTKVLLDIRNVLADGVGARNIFDDLISDFGNVVTGIVGLVSPPAAMIASGTGSNAAVIGSIIEQSIKPVLAGTYGFGWGMASASGSSPTMSCGSIPAWLAAQGANSGCTIGEFIGTIASNSG